MIRRLFFSGRCLVAELKLKKKSAGNGQMIFVGFMKLISYICDPKVAETTFVSLKRRYQRNGECVLLSLPNMHFWKNKKVKKKRPECSKPITSKNLRERFLVDLNWPCKPNIFDPNITTLHSLSEQGMFRTRTTNKSWLHQLGLCTWGSIRDQ